MTQPASTYDELPYSDRAFVQAHPDRLAVVGALHGLTPAPVDRCRVLELGCGAGGHLLPMAAVLPESRFVGIDLSARQIAQGLAIVERLGLANVELRRQDLMDFDAGEGSFDYVLCHGVYSWVPPPVQDRILAICRRGLAPRGLATISYNVYPGWHVSGAVRDILRYGARGAETPAEQVRRAMDFLGFVARSLFEADAPYARAVRAAAESLAKESTTYVFHEYLEQCNRPLSFEEFARRAVGAGLRYVGDASLRDPASRLTDEARQHLTAVENDLVRCEQTLDFLRNRTFRRDVLCHAGVATERWPQPAALKGMRLVALAKCVSKRPKAAHGAPERFENTRGHSISTADAAQKAALLALQRARPRAVAWAELMVQVGSSVPQADEADLGRFLLACGMASFVELHTHLPPIAGRAGERPEASCVARWQAAAGKLVVNLRHRSVQLDGLSRTVLAMLDGDHDRLSLCDALGARLADGTLKVTPPPGEPPRMLTRRELAKNVDDVLDALVSLSLLLGPAEDETTSPPD